MTLAMSVWEERLPRGTAEMKVCQTVVSAGALSQEWMNRHKVKIRHYCEIVAAMTQWYVLLVWRSV